MSLVLYLLTDKFISAEDDAIKQKYGTLEYICDVADLQNMHLYYADLLLIGYGLSYGNLFKSHSEKFLDYNYSDIFYKGTNRTKACFFEFTEQYEDMCNAADGLCFWYKYIYDNIHKLGKIGFWITWDDDVDDILKNLNNTKIIQKKFTELTPNDLASLNLNQMLIIEKSD